jgi:HSP20 family molecular chaperone IbpA
MSLIPFGPLSGLSSQFIWPKVQRTERESGIVEIGKDGRFKYSCNFQGFSLSEIKIYRYGHRVIIKAESKRDIPYEYYERSVKRILKLPDDVDTQSVHCKINDRGDVTVHARKLDMNMPLKRSMATIFESSE